MPSLSQQQVSQFRSMATLSDLAQFLATTRARLAYLLYQSPPAYRTFTVPKANGSTRTIEAPPAAIGAMQRRVADAIAAVYTPQKCVHGFTSRRSIATNADTHVRQGSVLNLDLTDFFWTIHFGRVRGIFSSPPFRYPSAVAHALAQLCCTNARLPQGAPSSPIISNLACRGLDRELSELARTHNCRYTRYADDITFSSSSSAIPPAILRDSESVPPILGDELLRIITERHHFRISEQKTRVRTRRERQEVTGLTVNRKVNVRRDWLRETRAAMHCWRRHGYTEAEARFHRDYSAKSRKHPPPPLESYLRGRIAFLTMVRCRGAAGDQPIGDPVAARYLAELAELSETAGPIVSGAASRNPFVLSRSLWIVCGMKDDVQVATGTAFALDRFGLVTAAHVFDEHAATSWFVLPAWKPWKKYPFSLIRTSSHHDLAQIAPPIPLPARLGAAHACALHGADVWVAGFPEWAGPADRVSVESSHVTSVRVLSLVRHLLTSATITPGMSGGPVLDKDGNVVGVVRYGSKSLVAPNSFVAVEHITELERVGRVLLLPSRRAEQ